jgi:hypothetical protein
MERSSTVCIATSWDGSDAGGMAVHQAALQSGTTRDVLGRS